MYHKFIKRLTENGYKILTEGSDRSSFKIKVQDVFGGQLWIYLPHEPEYLHFEVRVYAAYQAKKEISYQKVNDINCAAKLFKAFLGADKKVLFLEGGHISSEEQGGVELLIRFVKRFTQEVDNLAGVIGMDRYLDLSIASLVDDVTTRIKVH